MMVHRDDRALNLVRTATVLLGIIVTGINVATSGTRGSPGFLTDVGTGGLVAGSIGLGSLVLAVFTGILTTQYSRPILGTGEKPRLQIRRRQSHERALDELASEYDDQIRAMAGSIASNRQILWAVQIELFVAASMFTAALGFTFPRP